ncbi:MAG: SDR family NAD(P)-dependent oxidoreductase [Sporichthyaceae bacterium]
MASVAVVTGGGSGIGAATCARLIAEGLEVAVLDLDGDAAKCVAGSAAFSHAVDVADAASVDAAFGAVLREFGRVDVLVANAGITGSPAAGPCHTTPIEEWDRVQAVNVRGPYLCARAVLPGMLERRSGHVVTVASVAGTVAFPGRCAYTTSKGAALMFARSLAVDYGPSGIRSNAVCPGMVHTPMTAWRLDVPEMREAMEAKVPLGRVAKPDDIADAIALLATGRMAYMNGSAVVLDGGWTSV